LTAEAENVTNFLMTVDNVTNFYLVIDGVQRQALYNASSRIANRKLAKRLYNAMENGREWWSGIFIDLV
jgi:hypothetical protein